jgi:hypothetical protein
VSRVAGACEVASDAPPEPEVSAPAIGIAASAEPTPSATDRVLISPTARKGRLLRSADPSADDVWALFSMAMATPIPLRFPTSKSALIKPLTQVFHINRTERR